MKSFGQNLISDSYINFLENNPIENAYLNVPNEVHFTGDSIDIAGFITNLFFRPTDQISQVIKISLLDNQKGRIITSFYKNSRGSFSGKLFLPHTLKSGVYFLVAHTSYMGNFRQPLTDIKPIYIKNLWDEFEVSPNYSLPLVLNNAIKVYSELGSIITGVNQRMLIQTPDRVNSKAHQAIISAEGEEIIQTKLANGFGSIYLQPAAGLSYQLKIIDINGEYLEEINFKSVDDFAIKSAKVGSNLIISILKPSSENNKEFSLILESGHKLQSIIDIKFTETNMTTFVIPVNSLSGNFHSLVLIDKNRNVLANNTVFLKPKELLKISKKDTVKVSSNNDIVLNSEDEVNIAISIGSLNQRTLDKKLALVYTRADASTQISSAYKQLTVNDLLLTLHSNHYLKWQDILRSNIASSEQRFRPELGIDIRGNVETTNSSTLFANFFQAKDKISYQVEIDKTGHFYLPLSDFEYQETFIYSVSDSLGNVYENPVSFIKDSLNIVDFTIQDYVGDSSLIEQMTLKRISAQYLIDKNTKSITLYDRIPFDKKYLMDDFVILNTVEEVIEDIISLASLKKVKGEKTIRLDVPSLESTYYTQPTLIVNDRLINFSSFWSIPPIYIDEIKILYEPSTVRIYGSVGMLGGIIALKLKKHAPQSVLNKLVDKKIQLVGYAPKTNTPLPNGFPDFKSSFINIALPAKYDHSVKYRSSNLVGRFDLNIEGLTENGELVKYSNSILNIAD